MQAAEYTYKQFLTAGFKDPKVLSNMGTIYLSRNQVDKAVRYFREAIEAFPKYAEAYSNLGLILKSQGKLSEAEKALRKAVEIKPSLLSAKLNLGGLLMDTGNIKEAELIIRKVIKVDKNQANAHLSLGVLLKKQGKLIEAETETRNAIILNSKLSDAYLNLGSLLADQGKLLEAEINFVKAINSNNLLTPAYYNLSRLPVHKNHLSIWENLFSIKESQLNDLTYKIDLHFARSNILHKRSSYKESGKELKKANDLKLKLFSSDSKELISKSNKLLNNFTEISYEKVNSNKKINCIFIVGMPRCGSTLLESILGMNPNVKNLGEVDILDKSFSKWEENSYHKNQNNLSKMYDKLKEELAPKSEVTTDKNLYNYMYSGYISMHFPHARIIHCIRNPLDNILSIYKANFTDGSRYSSSLIDSSKVLINQFLTMEVYKTRFPSTIFTVNYDNLVRSPYNEIRGLMEWLKWEWEEAYLSPHLNQRFIETASNIQARQPINSKSLNGWENYSELLKPAFDFLSKEKVISRLIKKEIN